MHLDWLWFKISFQFVFFFVLPITFNCLTFFFTLFPFSTKCRVLGDTSSHKDISQLSKNAKEVDWIFFFFFFVIFILFFNDFLLRFFSDFFCVDFERHDLFFNSVQINFLYELPLTYIFIFISFIVFISFTFQL